MHACIQKRQNVNLADMSVFPGAKMVHFMSRQAKYKHRQTGNLIQCTPFLRAFLVAERLNGGAKTGHDSSMKWCILWFGTKPAR